jgi:hypothetical protein
MYRNECPFVIFEDTLEQPWLATRRKVYFGFLANEFSGPRLVQGWPKPAGSCHWIECSARNDEQWTVRNYERGTSMVSWTSKYIAMKESSTLATRPESNLLWPITRLQKFTI